MPTFLILANCAGYHFFHRLCFYQDRATEHLRPNSEEKKIRSRDVKKVELHLKDWLSRKCGKSAKHRKLQRCVAAQHAICCVHVAYVLRMTKPTQRCEGCKILKCL